MQVFIGPVRPGSVTVLGNPPVSLDADGVEPWVELKGITNVEFIEKADEA